MTRALDALIVLVLFTLPALAAPAPFPKPAREGPLTVEQLKLNLLHQHHLYVEAVLVESKSNSWLVVGSSSLPDGPSASPRKLYRVSADGDRASAELLVTDLTPHSHNVIIR